MNVLESERLLFRHLEMADLEELYALYRDPDIRRYIPDAPTSIEEARKELEWHQDGHPAHPQLGLWATVYKPTNQFIGRCGLLPWTIDDRFEVEVAYMIAKSHWGQGLGTAAARAIRDYGFDELDYPRLVALIDHGNRASIRVAEKIGMTFEKEGRDALGPFQLYTIERPALSAV